MKIDTKQSQRWANGFSLVELLLTLVLILCLAAASVFTFTAIYQSANLDEGSDRFQSLIRFAQAEAATTGRKVRLQFVPATPLESESEGSENGELRAIKVTWEADLLNAPGVFEEFTNKAWSEEIVNELVGVQKVQPIQSLHSGVLPSGQAAVPVSPEIAGGATVEEEFPSITFYPDGSCDSAEIVLASRNADDDRLLAVRLTGLLGSVSTRTIEADALAGGVEPAALPESGDLGYEDSFESSQSLPGEFSP